MCGGIGLSSIASTGNLRQRQYSRFTFPLSLLELLTPSRPQALVDTSNQCALDSPPPSLPDNARPLDAAPSAPPLPPRPAAFLPANLPTRSRTPAYALADSFVTFDASLELITQTRNLTSPTPGACSGTNTPTPRSVARSSGASRFLACAGASHLRSLHSSLALTPLRPRHGVSRRYRS